MNVYISCSSTDLEKHLDSYSLIRKEVLKLGHNISADWLGRIIEKGTQDIKKINLQNEGIRAISNAACVIADVSIPSSSVGYQIAYALSKKISVLCLYSEEFGRQNPPQIIGASNSSLLKIRSYTNRNIRTVIRSFFKNFPTEKLIKFNFIITNEIDKYLEWGAKKHKISKSEFLRDKVIDNIIDTDPQYKK